MSTQGADDGWQPIETAPKNRLVLTYAVRPSRSQVGYDVGLFETVGKDSVWYDQSYHELELYDWRVTHWMPLPAPPVIP